ncbi:XRE family transcriptional regulator [Aquitalea aquatica]|nr:helix-turn-helix transcriptional regulator [Aquitalea magnusonii]
MNSKTGTDGQMLLSGSLDQPESNRSALGSRIREAREAMGVPRIEAANVVGVSLSTFQAWEAGEREPDATKISIYAKKYGLAADWLLFGEGEMRKGSTDKVASSSDSQCQCCDTLGNPVDLDEFVFIPRYNLKAAAGHGAAVAGEKPIFSMSFRRYWIDNFLRIDPKDLSVLSVKGDSMEGVLNDRDVILVNHADTSPTTGLYVLRIEGDLLVKRVQKLPGGKLEIMSANEAYRPFEIDPANPGGDFAVVGRVVWFGRQL